MNTDKKLAEQVAAKMLEAEELDWTPDPNDPDDAAQSDLRRFSPSEEFDKGAVELVADARRLYLEALNSGLLDTAKGSAPHCLYGSDSVAEAFIRLAMDRRGLAGPERLYHALYRYGNF